MSILDTSGTFRLGDRMVKRLGYGAMQLAGKGVFGPPRDLDAAIAVLRAALEAGVDHIDTSDFYGPHVTNRLIREALSPYPEALTIVHQDRGAPRRTGRMAAGLFGRRAALRRRGQSAASRARPPGGG